jgi:hypothetical protein
MKQNQRSKFNIILAASKQAQSRNTKMHDCQPSKLTGAWGPRKGGTWEYDTRELTFPGPIILVLFMEII